MAAEVECEVGVVEFLIVGVAVVGGGGGGEVGFGEAGLFFPVEGDGGGAGVAAASAAVEGGDAGGAGGGAVEEAGVALGAGGGADVGRGGGAVEVEGGGGGGGGGWDHHLHRHCSACVCERWGVQCKEEELNGVRYINVGWDRKLGGRGLRFDNLYIGKLEIDGVVYGLLRDISMAHF